MFVDYEKAYDRVSRSIHLNMLAQSGYGAVFLSVITETLKFSSNLISENVFDATAGVRQGGSTSCSLFTFYMGI